MTFLVLIDDHPGSSDQRNAIRENHINYQQGFVKDGTLVVGGAVLDDENAVIGSAALLRCQSRADVKRWFKEDPYFKSGVWKAIKMIPLKIADDLFQP